MDNDPAKFPRIEKDTLNKQTLEEYIGSNNGFYKIRQFYTDLFNGKYGKNIDKFIAGELPRVVDGPLHAAWHGIITIGYGYPYRSAQTCIDGMAMAAHQYSALFPDNPSNPKRTDISKFGRGKTDIFEVCKILRDDKSRLKEAMRRPITLKLQRADSSPPFALLQYESDYFADLTDSIKLPDWFHPDEENPDGIIKLIDWILDVGVVVYVTSEKANDFFLLHGITCE